MNTLMQYKIFKHYHFAHVNFSMGDPMRKT